MMTMITQVKSMELIDRIREMIWMEPGLCTEEILEKLGWEAQQEIILTNVRIERRWE